MTWSTFREILCHRRHTQTLLPKLPVGRKHTDLEEIIFGESYEGTKPEKKETKKKAPVKKKAKK